MTECERIIKEDILPASFFEPETICDFYIDEKRKKIWAVLIDLLRVFDNVCNKYGLKYWLSFGGLLGAVRHNGFIPWDDDLDVCMSRNDYEILLSHADEFRDQYFLQIPGKDIGYYYSFAKLRNSNTTALSIAFRYQNFNQGCYLDIFPLDNCKENDIEENAEIIKELLIQNSTTMKRSNLHPAEKDIERYKLYPYRNPDNVYKEIENIAKKHNQEKTDLCGTTIMTFYKPQKMVWKKSWIDSLTQINFYGITSYIPFDYDNVLKTTYGKYEEYPPVEQRGVWHEGLLFDPDQCYKFWLSELRKKDSTEYK